MSDTLSSAEPLVLCVIPRPLAHKASLFLALLHAMGRKATEGAARRV